MKRIFQSIVLLGAIFALAFSSVSPAQAQGTSLSLVKVTWSSSGIIFIFNFEGNLSKNELTGSVKTTSGDEYPLYCWKLDDHTLRCTSSKKMAGQGDIAISLAGRVFSAKAPNERPEARSYSCPEDGYAVVVYDYYLSDASVERWTFFIGVTGNEQIDMDYYESAFAAFVQYYLSPLTVDSWTMVSFQCETLS